MTSSSSQSHFLPHIQGLRAVAVSMVLLFHFDLLGAVGGFAGVDIFFVISGYLITTMLVNRSDQPFWTSLWAFYAKRLRRILPAYFAVIFLVLIVGWFVFLPMDYARLGNSTAAAALFISNHYFQFQSGYFDTASIFKPLLHTWSLAVEIQFYLIWPLAFAIAQQLSYRTQSLILFIVIITSFISACLLSNLDPGVAFYSLPTRLWEFSFGALLANPWAKEKIASRLASKPIISWVSLLVLVGSAFVLNANMLWPGPWAIIPVLATAIILVDGMSPDSKSFGVYKLLSSVPMVWLGAISYSLYLVHWPITSIIFAYWWPEPNVTIRVAALLFSVPLAWCLYNFVERPFQFTGKRQISRNVSTFVSVGSCATLLLAGIGLARSDGFTSRYPDDLRNTLLAKYKLSNLPDHTGECPPSQLKCAPQNAASDYIYIWGDSHAGQFADSIKKLARQAEFQTLLTSVGGCPPLPNASRSRGLYGLKAKCLKANKQAFRAILENPKIKSVILAARWSFHMEGTRFGSETGSPTYVVRSNADELSVEVSKKILFEELNSALKAFSAANKRVVVIMQVPEFDNDGQRCFVAAKVSNSDVKKCDISRQKVSDRQANYRKMFNSLALKWDNVSLIDLNDQICGIKNCRITLDGNLAYQDNNHLLPGAAWKLLSAHKAQLFGL